MTASISACFLIQKEFPSFVTFGSWELFVHVIYRFESRSVMKNPNAPIIFLLIYFYFLSFAQYREAARLVYKIIGFLDVQSRSSRLMATNIFCTHRPEQIPKQRVIKNQSLEFQRTLYMPVNMEKKLSSIIRNFQLWCYFWARNVPSYSFFQLIFTCIFLCFKFCLIWRTCKTNLLNNCPQGIESRCSRSVATSLFFTIVPPWRDI